MTVNLGYCLGVSCPKHAKSWSKTWEPKSKTLEGGEMGMAVGKIEKLYVFTLQRAVTKWKNQMLTARQKKLSPFIG